MRAGFWWEKRNTNEGNGIRMGIRMGWDSCLLCEHVLYGNKWRGSTPSLRRGGKGRVTPIYTLAHHTHTQTKNSHNFSIKTARFRTIQFDHHRWTDQQTDGQTDKASYGVACPQLKRFTRFHERVVSLLMIPSGVLTSGWSRCSRKSSVRHFILWC